MKEPTGRDADNIAFGSTLSKDRHTSKHFDYLIANPPYGKDWKGDEDAVRAEHEKGSAGRFAPGLPRISDGQLLFLLNMLAHMKDQKEGGCELHVFSSYLARRSAGERSVVWTGLERKYREYTAELRRRYL
jgi:type I restriction enzyme M protein